MLLGGKSSAANPTASLRRWFACSRLVWTPKSVERPGPVRIRDLRREMMLEPRSAVDHLDARVRPLMRVCGSTTAIEVMDAFEEAQRQHELPQGISVDQGSYSPRRRPPSLWAYTKRIALDFNRPGKPTDSAYAQSFNATVRLRCLGRYGSRRRARKS